MNYIIYVYLGWFIIYRLYIKQINYIFEVIIKMISISLFQVSPLFIILNHYNKYINRILYNTNILSDQIYYLIKSMENWVDLH